MFLIQAALPASLVFILFIIAHLFVSNEGSGIYLPETSWDGDAEEVFPVPEEEIDLTRIDPETGGLLPDKYNYLKIENVFSGKIIGSEKLFSLEVALLTKQPSIASDLFISALFEMEGDLVAEITNVILEVELGQLESLQGREKLTSEIRDYVNGYLAANEARLRVFRNFALQIKALRDLGLSKKQIREILKKERIGKEELKALERGRYLPYSPSEAKLEEADEKNHDVPTRTLRILERELRRLSIDPEDPDPTPEGAFDTNRLSPRRDTKRRIITAPAPPAAPAPPPPPPATTTPPPATVNTSAASPTVGQISVEDLIQDPRTAQIARRRTMVG